MVIVETLEIMMHGTARTKTSWKRLGVSSAAIGNAIRSITVVWS
jgi:hypothetical protein